MALDLPDRPQPGQTAANIASGSRIAAMEQSPVGIDDDLARIDRAIGDVGFAEGLAERRNRLAQLTQSTQALEQFQRGAGSQNIADVEGMERASGERPSDILSAALGMRDSAQNILSQAASREIQGLNALTNFIKSTQDAVRSENSQALSLLDQTLTPEEKEKAQLTGFDAVAEVRAQGGDQFLKGSGDEKIATAERILRDGGVAKFKKNLPLDELISDFEKREIDGQTDLLIQLEAAQRLLESGEFGNAATGLIAQLIPGFAIGKNNREVRRAIEDIKAQYTKAISGATVSDKEMQRLKKFLPDTGKTEQENLEDIRKLARDIQINQRIFELGKKEGLTASEAYQKYGDDVFAEFGVSIESAEEGEKRVRVRKKDSGQTGSILEADFNQDIYERI